MPPAFFSRRRERIEGLRESGCVASVSADRTCRVGLPITAYFAVRFAQKEDVTASITDPELTGGRGHAVSASTTDHHFQARNRDIRTSSPGGSRAAGFAGRLDRLEPAIDAVTSKPSRPEVVGLTEHERPTE